MQAIPKLAASAAIAFSLALLAGCTQVEVFLGAATGDGTVYECSTRNGTTVELCYVDDAEDELGNVLGGRCGEPSRRWPRFANWFSMGCSYECPPKPLGCNARNGCYCP